MDKKIFALCALFCAYSAYGSGFQVLEQGAATMGSALAGATSNASGDASSAFWNPSAASFAPLAVGEAKFDAAMSFVIPSFEFTNSGSSAALGNQDGGNAGELAYVPNFFGVYRVTEDITATLSSTSPYGLETDYDKDWVGRYHAINSDLVTLDFNPSIAYKVCDFFSVNVGASLQWLHANLTQMMPDSTMPFVNPDREVGLSGDSWSGGANVGFTVKYAEHGQLGFSWRSEVSHDVRGNQRVSGNVVAPIKADLTLPQTFNVGVSQRLWGDLDRITLMADYAWTGWSSFEYLNIVNRDNGSTVSSVHENWKNTSRVAVGMSYDADFMEGLVLRLGTAWDESPVRSAEFRTARIPCADRLWFSCGAGYSFDNITIDIGYTYILFYNDAEIYTSGGSYNTLSGSYSGHAQVVAIQAGIYW